MPSPDVPVTARPVVKGWCPSALRPMLSGDGWLVRVRPPEGRLTVTQLAGLADLAERHGNGFVDLTSRANVQVRGVRQAALHDLQTGLVDLGLLDPALTAEAEANANIIVSPFWQPGDGQPDIAPGRLWQDLHAALTAPDAPRLPSKFGFAIDIGHRWRWIADASADIRIENVWTDLVVRADGATTGRKAGSAGEAVAIALDMARWFVASGGVGADGRGRMRAHLARGAVLPDALGGTMLPRPRALVDGVGATVTGRIIGLSFGQAPGGTIRKLAAAAAGPVRVTPWRSLILPEGSDWPMLENDRTLIVDPRDPRRHVFACTGRPGCAQARASTRDIAERIAQVMPPGRTAHVSGCPKGCAHSGPADLTVVRLPERAFAVGYGVTAGAVLRVYDFPGSRGAERALLAEWTHALRV